MSNPTAPPSSAASGPVSGLVSALGGAGRSLAGRTCVLGITGGISAYKGAELCRLLVKAGATVRVVMTRAAQEFITPLTLQTLSGHPVAADLFDLTHESQIGHIQLADEADLVIIAPASADAIARLAAGMADDLLATVVLAGKSPVLLAPAMNVNMWQNPLTQANLKRLIETGRFHTVGPDAGELACGWVGAGRLVEPAEIAATAESLLAGRAEDAGALDPLVGKRIVVTAGPTFEAIDDVRFIGNRSSGKMGFALAEEAARAGALVTLIAGPVALATPLRLAARVDVESAGDMQAALAAAVPQADVIVMCAAVADYRPAERTPGKLNRRSGASSLTLVGNPDLLADIGRARQGKKPLLVGFAAETGLDAGAMEARAREKLQEKRCDVVIANDIGRPGFGFGSDRNAVTLVFADRDSEVLPPATKVNLAREIWKRLALLVPAGTSSPRP